MIFPWTKRHLHDTKKNLISHLLPVRAHCSNYAILIYSHSRSVVNFKVVSIRVLSRFFLGRFFVIDYQQKNIIWEEGMNEWMSVFFLFSLFLDRLWSRNNCWFIMISIKSSCRNVNVLEWLLCTDVNAVVDACLSMNQQLSSWHVINVTQSKQHQQNFLRRGSERACFPHCLFSISSFFLFSLSLSLSLRFSIFSSSSFSCLDKKKRKKTDVLESFISLLNWLLRRILRSSFFSSSFPSKTCTKWIKIFFHSLSLCLSRSTFSFSHSFFCLFPAFFFSFFFLSFCIEESAIRTRLPHGIKARHILLPHTYIFIHFCLAKNRFFILSLIEETFFDFVETKRLNKTYDHEERNWRCTWSTCFVYSTFWFNKRWKYREISK